MAIPAVLKLISAILGMRKDDQGNGAYEMSSKYGTIGESVSPGRRMVWDNRQMKYVDAGSVSGVQPNQVRKFDEGTGRYVNDNQGAGQGKFQNVMGKIGTIASVIGGLSNNNTNRQPYQMTMRRSR